MESSVTEEIPFQEVLREALREGGEFADLFFEETHSTVIVCEEDRIEKVISGLDIGAGLRILFEGRTIYSFTNQVSKEGLFDLARTVNRGIKETGGERTIALSGREGRPLVLDKSSNPLLRIERDPEGISVGEKVSIVKRANDVAWKLDRHVRQARVLYRDFTRVFPSQIPKAS